MTTAQLTASAFIIGTDERKAIGSAPDAVRMHRVVGFYEKLPRGPAPAPKPKGLLQRYQARYFGENTSAMRKAPV